MISDYLAGTVDANHLPPGHHSWMPRVTIPDDDDDDDDNDDDDDDLHEDDHDHNEDDHDYHEDDESDHHHEGDDHNDHNIMMIIIRSIFIISVIIIS